MKGSHTPEPPRLATIKHRYAGIFLITPDRKVIGQRRDDKPGIDNPGKVGIFGGAVEAGERPHEAVWRELVQEETNLQLATEAIKPFWQETAWRTLTQEWERRHFFTAAISEQDLQHLKVYEGQGWAYINGPNDPALPETLRPAVQRLFAELYS